MPAGVYGIWVDSNDYLRSQKIKITDGTTLTSELQSGTLTFTDTSGYNSTIQGSGAVFGDTNNNSSGQYAVSGFYLSLIHI